MAPPPLSEVPKTLLKVSLLVDMQGCSGGCDTPYALVAAQGGRANAYYKLSFIS